MTLARKEEIRTVDPMIHGSTWTVHRRDMWLSVDASAFSAREKPKGKDPCPRESQNPDTKWREV
jgi:hypothetical protein